MHYRIYIEIDADRSTDLYQIWPLATTLDPTSLEDAETAFEKFQELETYKETLFGSNNFDMCYPLVLKEYEDEHAQDCFGTELDRFEPGLILDDEFFEEDDVKDSSYPMVECGRRSYYLFRDAEAAGDAVEEYYRDMVANDRQEFTSLIGEERLLQWAVGESDSFGISSLEDFFEIAAKHPEEHWASYDGHELDVDAVSPNVELTLGFIPTVAYRCN